MSNITEWIRYELYPTLFESIDIALPEHQFKKHSGDWRSKTYLTGSPHKDRIDKTVVTKKAPGYILEQGGEVLSLVDYIIKRDSIEFIEAVKTLADVVGLEIPKGELSSENYQKYKDQATILEDCNSYFIYCLENSKGADEVKTYLSSRGYSSEDVKAMELGYISNQESLNKYLLTKGYSQELINEVVTIKTDTRIGSTHSLTIPYRSGGSVKGFKFRIIGDSNKKDTGHKAGGYKITLGIPKYLNSSGLDRLGGFFNLSGIKGDKDVVIVEGELDSLHATIKGVENVVATGGSSISSDQVNDAIKRGAKSFTICLDTEPGKEEATAKKITSAIDILLSQGVNRVYIVTLPDLGGDKTDPDRLIKESGVDSFKTAIAQALPYYEYKLQETLNKYIKIEEDNGLLTYKDKDNLLDEIVTTASTLDPLHKEQYTKAFTSLEPIVALGITEESLAITVDRLTSTRDKEAQATDFKKLLTEVTKLQDSGEVDKALELLDSRVKEVKLKDKATEFSSLLLPIKEEELRQRLTNKPESLNSGYTIGGEELLLPSGAITVLSAPTSHGKTTFLINLALNVAQAYPDKETYLFSYEEDSDSILINALNTYLDNNSISNNNRTTLKNHFTGANKKVIEGKDKFFKELIDTKRLNIHYSNYSSDTLIEAIRYLYKHAKPGAIFIDYIQLLNLPEGKYKTYSRQEEIKQICIALKDIAVETGLPIILGAQFNREVVNQLRIHATKIGEAGDIERIANLIIGFWNNNFKPLALTDGETNEIGQKGCFTPDTIYTTVLKNRGGIVGKEELLSFNGNTGKISNQSKQSNDFF
jgi:DNA primase catalytic core